MFLLMEDASICAHDRNGLVGHLMNIAGVLAGVLHSLRCSRLFFQLGGPVPWIRLAADHRDPPGPLEFTVGGITMHVSSWAEEILDYMM